MMAGLIKVGSIVTLLLFQDCNSFVFPKPPVSVNLFGTQKEVGSWVVTAKKRRKRRDGGEDSSGFEFSGDELPDFDIGGEEGEEVEAQRTSTRTMSAEGEISDAMMGAQKQLGTINDLLSDRSLESKFKFEEPEEPLPDLVELAKAKASAATAFPGTEVGKRAQQAARKAAAMAASEEEKEDGFLSKLIAKLGKDEDGKDLSPVKLLEQGTWFCIYTLVAWEIYLNSPLFERAAPMAPVVYSTPLP